MNLPYIIGTHVKNTSRVRYDNYCYLVKKKRPYETRGVVIPSCFGVSERLEYGIGLDDLVLKRDLLLLRLSTCTNGCEVRDDLLCVLRLSGSRLSSNQDGLVLVV
jgi:hypothetical protein